MAGPVAQFMKRGCRPFGWTAESLFRRQRNEIERRAVESPITADGNLRAAVTQNGIGGFGSAPWSFFDGGRCPWRHVVNLGEKWKTAKCFSMGTMRVPSLAFSSSISSGL